MSRKSFLATAVAAVTGCALAVPFTADAQTTASATAAPYVDMSNSQVDMLHQAITGAGLKSFSAAFVTGSGCDQIWGDTLPIGKDPKVDGEIEKARSEGASPIISTGGAAGLPLAWTCTDQQAIQKGYQQIIDTYKVNQLDFDIEGAAQNDTAAAARNMKAVKALKASNPDLEISVTLPVLPDGLTQDGLKPVQAAKDAGVRIDIVNIMAMDYNQGSQDMGKAATSAAQATLKQIQGIDSGYSNANIGITPMIGTNDDNSTLTMDNAKAVAEWAKSNQVGRLSFWSLNRDKACDSAARASSTCSGVAQSPLDFTKAFTG
ncbi:chitinase [Sciscionella marina]|uniref:chitinase n=1 Tax=Sciscionella marina TaxID=508770 RepID=UPI00037A32EF|nr:chitinase [Sciscionella marina]